MGSVGKDDKMRRIFALLNCMVQKMSICLKS